ncbi:MAG: tetratricopeptide repeat protein [Candidatus Hodarchaeales archaeon]|jgi:tetratricopeptide (TPR) repeat protein
MPKDYDKILEKGKALYKTRKFLTAIRTFNSIIKKHPDHDLAWLYIARSQYHLTYYEKAKKSIDVVIDLNPKRTKAWVTKVDILLNIGTYEETINCCLKALQLHPQKFLHITAIVYEHYRQYDKALECMEKAVRNKPNNEYLNRIYMVMVHAVKFGKNYYIPIAKSNLLLFIPPEDEIIYSTKANVTWQLAFKGDIKFTGRGFSQSIQRDRGSINVDTLITSKGVALTLPIPKTGTNIPQYIPWKKITFAPKGQMVIDSRNNYKLDYDRRYETKEEFESRCKTFRNVIKSLRYEITKEHLDIARELFQLAKYEDALYHIEFGLKSNYYQSEIDLSEDLTYIKNSIHKVKELETTKMINEIETKFINFLNSNKGKVFTFSALITRIWDNAENPKLLEYNKKNGEGILNRLAFNHQIQSIQKEGKTFFYLQ